MSKNKKPNIEETYPGVTKQIENFENSEIPTCPHCGSEDTAIVRAGIIGRSITIAASTRKMKLVPNITDEMGKYFCRNCERYFE